jgi:hypothetical protein
MSEHIGVETKGSVDMSRIAPFFIETLSGKAVAKVAAVFTQYLKDVQFKNFFVNRTDETRESIGLYRGTSKKPVYVVKAGVDITGSLNYLMGLYRGEVNESVRKTKSGKIIPVKAFRYSRPRNMLEESWKRWGGDEKAKAVGNEMIDRYIKEAEEKLER